MEALEARVASAVEVARRLLHSAKRPLPAGNGAHRFADVFRLAETLVAVGLAAQATALEALGADAGSLQKMRAWSREKNVTLRLGADEFMGSVFSAMAKGDVYAEAVLNPKVAAMAEFSVGRGNLISSVIGR